MAYSELIKNFDKIRDYMRDFYVYGFKNRDEYNENSSRTYDNEKRRLESWLSEYMRFVRNSEGKNVFISIDSRAVKHNPLYRAWKSKSFTHGDITLHFILFDILSCPEKSYKLSEILEIIDRKYLSKFEAPMVFDESTVRKKLAEYVKEGIITANKKGKSLYYSRNCGKETLLERDYLSFFSEVAPCGVIGSFLLDKLEAKDGIFLFKHHYITSAVDMDILATIFCAMSEKRKVSIMKTGLRSGKLVTIEAIPLYVLSSVQNGKQNVLVYEFSSKSFQSIRIDYIDKVEILEESSIFDEKRRKAKVLLKKMWGASCHQGKTKETNTVSFVVKISKGEEYVLRRLERERRIGEVVKTGEDTYKFKAEVYDSTELVPWIRTFLGRIIKLNFSDRTLENRFRADVLKLYGIYGISEEKN